MQKYFIRRVLQLPLTLLGCITITFVFVRMLPGQPFYLSEKTTTKFIAEQNKLQGLDLSLPIQFWNFLGRLVRFDFGNSYFGGKKPVAGLIWDHFMISIVLISVGFGFMVLLGLTGGFFVARKQNTWWDYSLNTFAVFFSSVPSFVLAAFCFGLGRWLTITYRMYEAPIGGWGNQARGIPPSFLQIFFPALILAVRPAATVMRMTYTQTVEVKDEDYVRTGYAKGLLGSAVRRNYIFRNSLIPVASVIGNLTGLMLIGVAEIELVFQIPGLGYYFINGILQLDYPVVVGTTCFYLLVIVLINLLVDLLYALLDPRVSYQGKK